MEDNLFTESIEEVSVEFAKKYIRQTRMLLQQETSKTEQNQKQIQLLQKVEDNFKQISLGAVKGSPPHSVICHGDFWNNNIMYKLDVSKMLFSQKYGIITSFIKGQNSTTNPCQIN